MAKLFYWCYWTISLRLRLVGGMENEERKTGDKMMFSLVWYRKENTKDEKCWRKKSTRAHKFFSSQFGRKTGKKREKKRSGGGGGLTLKLHIYQCVMGTCMFDLWVRSLTPCPFLFFFFFFNSFLLCSYNTFSFFKFFFLKKKFWVLQLLTLFFFYFFN